MLFIQTWPISLSPEISLTDSLVVHKDLANFTDAQNICNGLFGWGVQCTVLQCYTLIGSVRLTGLQQCLTNTFCANHSDGCSVRHFPEG